MAVTYHRMEDQYNCVIHDRLQSEQKPLHLFQYIKVNTEAILHDLNHLYKNMQNGWIFRFLIKDGEQSTQIFDMTISNLMETLGDIALLYKTLGTV